VVSLQSFWEAGADRVCITSSCGRCPIGWH